MGQSPTMFTNKIAAIYTARDSTLTPGVQGLNWTDELGDYRRVHPSSIKQPIENNKPETRYEIQNRNKSRRAKTGSAHRAEHHRNKPRRQPSEERLVHSTVKSSISGIQPGTPMAAGTSTAKRADARLAATMF